MHQPEETPTFNEFPIQSEAKRCQDSIATCEMFLSKKKRQASEAAGAFRAAQFLKTRDTLNDIELPNEQIRKDAGSLFIELVSEGNHYRSGRHNTEGRLAPKQALVKYDEAMGLVPLCEISQDDARYGELCYGKAHCHFAKDEFQTALVNFEKAINVFEKLPEIDVTLDEDCLAQSYLYAGLAHTHSTDVMSNAAAEDNLKKALAVAETIYGDSDKKLVDYLQSLVNFYRKLSCYSSAADKYVERINQLCEKTPALSAT